MTTTGEKGKDKRFDARADALRQNLLKRKQQARSQKDQDKQQETK